MNGANVLLLSCHNHAYALWQDEASESSYVEDLCQSQREEMENLLVQQRQELETMKDKHDQILMELELVQKQKLSLERQLVENCDTEKVLEEKIIQAVNLMISFKEKRDMLWIQRDNALEEAQKYKKLIKADATALCVPHFFECGFLDIMEATQNLDPSMKIGEGTFGSVYKGAIRQTKVAIKMLPPFGSQSDSDFEYKVKFRT